MLVSHHIARIHSFDDKLIVLKITAHIWKVVGERGRVKSQAWLCIARYLKRRLKREPTAIALAIHVLSEGRVNYERNARHLSFF
jgi:hypothetical protein